MYYRVLQYSPRWYLWDRVEYGNLKNEIRGAIRAQWLVVPRKPHFGLSLKSSVWTRSSNQMTSSLEGCATMQRRGCDASHFSGKKLKLRRKCAEALAAIDRGLLTGNGSLRRLERTKWASRRSVKASWLLRQSLRINGKYVIMSCLKQHLLRHYKFC